MNKQESRISIIFFGTDEFAKIILKALKNADFNIVAEITEARPVAELALPPADLGVVAVYGKILPKSVLEHFKYGVLNVHPSLLPKYRGPSPIKTALLNGDIETGVTIIKLDDQMDHGPVLISSKHQIPSTKMHSELRDELATLGAELLVKVIPDYIAEKIVLQHQDHSQATYTKLLTRDDGKVDLPHDAPEMIYRKFLAFEGWPGIWFLHRGKRVKILDCMLDHDTLKIVTLQPEGKKPMGMKDFINGYGIITNS